jgi:hypothetical protein
VYLTGVVGVGVGVGRGVVGVGIGVEVGVGTEEGTAVGTEEGTAVGTEEGTWSGVGEGEGKKGVANKDGAASRNKTHKRKSLAIVSRRKLRWLLPQANSGNFRS